MDIKILYNTPMYMQSHTFHYLLVRGKSQDLPTLSKRELYKNMDTRRQGSLGPIFESVCLSNSPNILIESVKPWPFSKAGRIVNVCGMPETPH